MDLTFIYLYNFFRFSVIYPRCKFQLFWCWMDLPSAKTQFCYNRWRFAFMYLYQIVKKCQRVRIYDYFTFIYLYIFFLWHSSLGNWWKWRISWILSSYTYIPFPDLMWPTLGMNFKFLWCWMNLPSAKTQFCYNIWRFAFIYIL